MREHFQGQVPGLPDGGSSGDAGDPGTGSVSVIEESYHCLACGHHFSGRYIRDGTEETPLSDCPHEDGKPICPQCRSGIGVEMDGQSGHPLMPGAVFVWDERD